MAGYRRLISYIYAYEGEEKGKNIGFAKLEARNGQCRLSINVKKIYAGGNDMGVYLLSSGQEIFLGNIFIRNGSGDFRTCVNVENVMGTGCSMDSCIGLVIHEKGEDWRIYKTVWEDAVAQAAELEFAEVPRIENALSCAERWKEKPGRSGALQGNGSENCKLGTWLSW